MPNWVAMGINVGYMVAAYFILNRFKPKIFQDARLSLMWAELFLASIFLVIGAILFNIPIGFFGMNNPHITTQLKEKWWAAPGITLSFLLFSLSFKNSFESFKQLRFTTAEVKKLSIGSTLFGAALTVLFLIAWTDTEEVPPWAGPLILKYWWAVWLGLAFLHLCASMAMQGIRSALYADNT